MDGAQVSITLGRAGYRASKWGERGRRTMHLVKPKAAVSHKRLDASCVLAAAKNT